MDEPDWKIPERLQPAPDQCGFDLDSTLRSVMVVRANIPPDASTAQLLGTERSGNAVLIGKDGLALTIGYLINEAEAVWLTGTGSQVAPAHVIAIDQPSGFGLVQALGRLDLPPLDIGESKDIERGQSAIFAAAGGRPHALKVEIAGRQPFAGYWEYLLEHPFFTHPAHPVWSGGALIADSGRLIGIGSLIVQHTLDDGRQTDLNMVVPTELLTPIIDELLTKGRGPAPPRPWLGLYCGENDATVFVQRVTAGGPADQAHLRPGDRILAIAETEIEDLATLWRAVWAQGSAGVTIPMTLSRGTGTFEAEIVSADRAARLKGPRLQ
jgi:S1-C subfamily serine protease